MGDFIAMMAMLVFVYLIFVAGEGIGKIEGQKELRAQAVHRGLAEWKVKSEEDGKTTVTFSWTAGHD